ncbi:unnamed protein product [Spodoptera exigua]|nr:unnamed protein product [Spodoptera exigua]
MVQEILTHNGDVLKFSGDAFLSMWKKTAKLSMQDVVHNAIDCGLIIQKNYGNFITDVGVVLKVRPAVIEAVRNSWYPELRRFMAIPVLRAVENDEPMEFLTEVRRVIVVFLNIITRTVTPDVLIELVDTVYKQVSSLTSESGGLVNKVSMFDKDMMILIVFGLRGLSHEDEAQHALLCAHHIKDQIVDPNVLNVSIGVTSGTTYCGVVGHILRREYTVIGPAVNKAARLMMSYQNKVTCDKETFLRSKIEQEYFKQLESKPLKGIAKPGPVYEFNYSGWPERPPCSRHPILGRNDEMRIFKRTLQNAMEQQNKNFTRYRDHIYGIAFTGEKLIGKTRMIDECLFVTPDFIRKKKFVLCSSDNVPYHLFRSIMSNCFRRGSNRNAQENKEIRIRQTIIMEHTTPLQVYGINTIFECQFPLPENFKHTGDILSEFTVKIIIQDICKKILGQMCVVAVEEAQYIDDESWHLIMMLLETKILFFVFSIVDIDAMSVYAKSCFHNNMIKKVPLAGIDRTYHAALACQLLDVQAIPADLEKVIESASGGSPGWIQNFLIALVQRGALIIVTMTRQEVQKKPGLVLPASSLLQKVVDVEEEELTRRHSFQSIYSLMSVSMLSKQDQPSEQDGDNTVQVAVLADSYAFEDIKVDMAMDAIILKTYDSLTPFEKMLLKCGSVLGDVFSRRMLLNLLQCDSPRKVAQAIAKLFIIRVLECEGGDFTHDTSLVLVHPAPSVPDPKPPYCACLGTRQPPNCRDLPMYAFCGFMKFRHSLFRTTTYEMLTETQKHEMHARALLYLERYTRRCTSCGAGCFSKLLGLRCDDGLIPETEELKRTRLQISALSAEAKIAGEEKTNFYFNDASMDYPTEDFYPKNLNKKWVRDFCMANIFSLRGICMLESGDHSEARKHLLHAMKLYRHPFPTSTHMIRLANMGASFHQVMALYVAPNFYIERESGIIGSFYEDIAYTLYRLYRLFMEAKEPANATLAAKWCLQYALRTNSNFRLLCVSYANMIADYGQRQKFSMCEKLEKRAMEICRRKRGQLDVTEVPAIPTLFTLTFCSVDRGKKIESLEFGLSVMHMLSSRTEMNTRESLVLCMLKLLLSDLKINDMVTIMREFFYLTDHYDLCSETWYYYYAIVILLDTGYCVESYGTCEKFYMKKGDALLRSKTPEAAWNFFVCMWLVTIRVGAWERSILWEEKIKQLLSMKLNTNEFNMMIVIRLVEGLLIALVREHWKGILDPKYVDYWSVHVEPNNLLDFRDFDPQNSTIIPYTLPLPTDLDK